LKFKIYTSIYRRYKREILSQKISDKYEKLNPVIVQDALDMNVNLNTNFSQIKHEIAQL